MRTRIPIAALIWTAPIVAWVGALAGSFAPITSGVVVAIVVTAGAIFLAGEERLRRVRLVRWASRRRDRSRRSQRRLDMLRGAFNSLDTALFLADEQGIVRACNIASERMFPRRDRLIGAPLEDLFTQSEAHRVHALAVEGVAGEARLRIERAGAVRIYELDAFPIEPGPRGGRPSVLLAMRDVTEQANAMQLKTDFVANASHELRTPLTAIRGAVETLRGLEPAPTDAHIHGRLVAMVEGQVERLEALMNDLLDLSRLESHPDTAPVEKVDLTPLCDGLATLFDSRLRERGLTIEFDIDPALSTIRTNRRLLETVLKNLIDNATKFAHDRTAVVVKGRVIPPSEPGGTATDARFEVIDRGIGIPLEHQQRIFERFFQVDPARSGAGLRGTGLGLAIVKHAVRNLGGTVGVSSVWKKGATLWFELPDAFIPTEQPEDADGANAEPTAAPGNQ